MSKNVDILKRPKKNANGKQWQPDGKSASIKIKI
jgi:hypothetical protein